MQKKPNFNQRATRFTRSNTQTVQILPKKSVCFSSTLSLFYSFIRKMPTFRHVLQISDINTLNSIYNKDLQKYSTNNTFHPSQNTSKEFYPPKAENMQNEPNFTHNFSHILTRLRRLLKLFTRKMRTFRHVLQISDLNTLNSIYNKDLHNLLSRNTLSCTEQNRRNTSKDTKICKTNPIPNQPPLHSPRPTGHGSRFKNYAKRNQFNIIRT